MQPTLTCQLPMENYLSGLSRILPVHMSHTSQYRPLDLDLASSTLTMLAGLYPTELKFSSRPVVDSDLCSQSAELLTPGHGPVVQMRYGRTSFWVSLLNHAGEHIDLPSYVRACVRACVRECVRQYARACVLIHVCSRQHAC